MMRIKNKFFERFKSVLFTAVLISCLLIFPIRIAHAQEPAEHKPNKATTVDECIREEACVWHAFDLLVTQDYQDFGAGTAVSADDNVKIRKETREKWKFKKWERPVNIGILGDVSDVFNQEIIDTIQKFKPYLKQDIGLSQTNITTIIMFSDNIRRDFYGKYYGYLSSGMNHTIKYVESQLGSKYDNKIKICTVVPIPNKDFGVEFGVLLIDTNPLFRSKCLESGLYGILAYPYKLLNFPDKDVVNLDFVQETLLRPEISELDLLLLKIIQNQKLVAGMTYEQVKEKFHEVYIVSVTE